MHARKIILGIIAAMMLMPLAASAESNSSRLNKERLEVGRALLEVTSANVDSIIPFYTDDIEYHDPIVDIFGINDMTVFLYQLFGSTPDLITTVHDEIAIDDTYTATWTMVGTFLIRDEGGNVIIGEDGQPVGIPYEAEGMSIVKFHPKTTDVWFQRDYYSEADIMQGRALLGFRADDKVTFFHAQHILGFQSEMADAEFFTGLCQQIPDGLHIG